MSDLSRFFKHSSIYAVGNIINRIGAFVLLPVYTNYLTVGEYGTLELFYVLMSVVSGILAVGLAHATLRFYFDYDDIKERNLSVSTNYIGSLLITFFGVLALSFFSNNLSLLVFNNTDLTLGIYIIFATLVLELSSQICLAYVRAIEYSFFFIIVSFLKLIVQVSVNTYLVIFKDAGVVGVLAGNFCTVALGWIILSYFTLSRCGIGFSLRKFIPVLKYSYPFLLATLMGIVASQADKFILNSLVSLEALGLFALALKFSMIIEQLIGEPFSRSYGAFRYTIMEKDDASIIQANIVKYLTIVAVFFALCMAFFAQDVIYIMSDKEFWAASDLVPIIMLSAVFKILTYPAQTGILYAKETKYLFYFTTTAAVISLTGNFLLISAIGLFGACISLVITEFSILFLTNKISQRFFAVGYDYKRMFAIIFFAVIIYIFSILIAVDNLILSLVIKSILVFIYCASVYFLNIITVEEKQQLSSYLNTGLRMLKNR